MILSLAKSILKRNSFACSIIQKLIKNSTVLLRLNWILNEYKLILNWFDLILILKNFRKKIDIFFKNGFIFYDFKKEYWRYLNFYIIAFKKGFSFKNLGNKIFAYIDDLKIQLLDQINGIYQIKSTFIDQIYNRFQYNNKIVIDIGGYIGDTALYFIKNGAKKVYIYEINPDIFKILQQNISMNDLDDKLIAINKGIGNSYKKVTLNIPELKGSSSIFEKLGEKMKIIDKIEVDIIPFNEIIIENIDILKIDCEGCEFEILQNILENKLADKIFEGIILEAHNIDENHNSEQVKSFLKKIGFNKIQTSEKSKDWELIYATRQ